MEMSPDIISANVATAIRILDAVHRGIGKIVEIPLPFMAPAALKDAQRDLRAYHGEVGRALTTLRSIK